MKGQTTIEFLGALMLYLLVIITVVNTASNKIPEFNSELQEKGLNLEARQISSEMITQKGYHNYGNGGTNWAKNNSTTKAVTSFGLASEYMKVDKDKIDRLGNRGNDKLTYSEFIRVEKTRNQYFFNFTWMPIVETPESFTRTKSPGFITEPDSVRPDGSFTEYGQLDNEVHYGNITLLGSNYKFLVASNSSAYDVIYFSETWDFSGTNARQKGSTISLNGEDFQINKIQQRAREPGAMLVLKNHLKSFGPTPTNQTSRVIKLNRYPLLDAPGSSQEIMRMEVLAW